MVTVEECMRGEQKGIWVDDIMERTMLSEQEVMVRLRRLASDGDVMELRSGKWLWLE